MRDIKDVAKYVGISMISKGLTVSPLKLQKMLYYVQAWYMVFFGRENTLFEDIPEAWVNGPVYPVIYHIYKDKVSGMFDNLRLSDFTDIKDEESAFRMISNKMAFTKDEEEFIDSVITLYGSKSENELVLYTHIEKPWSEKREGLKPYENSNEKLSLDTIYNYYRSRHKRNQEKYETAN